MRRFISVLLISLLVLLTYTACAANTDNAEGKTKIRFVLDWLPNTNHTGLYVALDQGYFSQEGLDVEIVQPPEGGALSLLASGDAQFGISFQEEIAAALTADEPLPVTAVAAVLQHNTSGIISLKEKGIERPRDMEGKRYATWSMPIEQAILKNVVARDGGDFSKIIMVPSTVTDVITALQTDIDAVWIYYGWDGVAAELAKLETNYFYFKDIDPVLDFYTPVIASNVNYLDKNPEIARKFLKAVSKGYEYAIENPDKAADILVKMVPEIDRELARKSQEYLAGQYKAEAERWGIIDAARWNNFYQWMYENELISRKLEPGEGFTNEYLPK